MLADLRFSIRSLARRRGYSAACVVTLGVATSVPFAAFALVDATLLRPIPLTEPDRVFTLLHTQADGYVTPGFLYSELERVLGTAEVFEAVAGHGRFWVSATTAAGARPAGVSVVTERFFDVVGLRPALGRGFAPAEHRAGTEPVAVVTDAFWRSRLGGDPAAIGRTIRIDGHESVVVGVLPRGFRGLRLTEPADIFMPLSAAPLVAPPMNLFSDQPVLIDGLAQSPTRWILFTARLKAGATAAGAEAALNTVIGRAGTERGGAGGEVSLMPATRAALPPRVRGQVVEFVAMLSAASGLILLAGCTSVAGMMLVRQERRRREMAVRSWLGAGRLRIVRLFLVEALLLTGVGAAAGFQIALWLARAAGGLAALPGGVEMAAWPPAGSVGRLAGTGALAAVATGVLCGLVPALQSLHPSPAQSGRWRGLALAGQVAVVVALTIGAGLFVRSMRAAVAADVGFESGGLSYAGVSFDGRGHAERVARARDFHDRVIERLAARPGVEAVTFGDLPLVGNSLSMVRVEIDGGALQLPTPLEAFFGGPDYMRTLGLRLLAGRDFGDRDVEGREPVAVVSESLARRLWGGQEALGRRFTARPLEDVRVIGVVDDGRFGGLRDAGGFAVFLPWEQNRLLASRSGTVFGRTEGDAEALAAAIAQEIRAFDGEPRFMAAGTFRDRLGALAEPQRVGAVILSGLGGFTLLLAMVGVYGSAAQTAAGRARELGIRIALGAGRAAIVGTVLSRTLAYVGIGAAAGVGAAAAFGVFIEPHLFEVGPRDPATYAAMTFAIVSAAALAGLAAALAAVREASVNRLIRQATAAE